MVKRASLVSIKCTYKNCKKILSSKYNLKRHIEFNHLGVRPHECEICFKRFTSKQNRLEHIRMEHSYSLLSSEKLPEKIIKANITIPRLTLLVRKCMDPDIRPMSKLEKIYLFPEDIFSISLPAIQQEKTINIALPQYSEIINNK